MWTPPERLRHRLPETRWPTAEEAARSRLFSPVRLGPLTARQRSWVPAMVPWRATEDGLVTDDVVDWYARFAQGKPGVIVVEATGIREVPSGPLLRIGHDRFVPGLSRLTRAVREASAGETLLFIQLIDFLQIRRRPEAHKFFERFLAITSAHRDALSTLRGEPWLRDAPEAQIRAALGALPDTDLERVLTAREVEDLRMGHRERVTDLGQPHIRELPRVLPGLFADAAERAFASGFDGVELHYAHAYTMASFLSRTNDRTDGYGVTPEGRVRLPLEVFRAVRERVGSRCVGARFLGDEVILGGSRLDDAVFYALRFAEAGMDFLSLSKGGKFDDAKQPEPGEAAYPYTGRSGYECMPTVYSDAAGPFGRNVPQAARIRAELRDHGHQTPVVAAGGIATFEQAEAILTRGEADVVAAARQSLADPDWFLKARLGRGDEIRRCSFTNYCEALDQRHRQVTCKLWDRVDLTAEGVKLDPTGKRRLVAPAWSMRPPQEERA
ncbi:MAG: oxidoreductase [Deltaproteobacteria bacterium]